MASRASFRYFANPRRSARRAAQHVRPAFGMRRAAPSGRSSGLLLPAGGNEIRREEAKASNSQSPARLTVPLNFPPLPALTETLLDDPPLVIEDFSFSAPFEDPVPTAPKSAGEETASTSSVIERLTKLIEELTAHEIAMTEVAGGAKKSVPALPAATEDPGTDGCVTAPVLEILPGIRSKKKLPAESLLEFYGLKQQPFDVTPDPAFLYFSPSHREALESLSQGIEHLRGFMMLVAEPGMGKTTLMNKLMEEVSDSAHVIFLFQTQCNSNELLGFILNELEVDHAGMDVVAMHRVLNQALLEEMLRGQRFVLIVDEAQNLQEPVLETIRLLSDFETTHSKLIQIVLVGQPQLADTLKRPGLKQLRQRVSVLASLKPLGAAETAEYIELRLRAAGWGGRPIFTPEAVTQIAKSSEGVPRAINNLCFNALLAGFQGKMEIIDADLIKSATEKLNVGALASLPEEISVPAQSVVADAPGDTAQLARAIAAALAEGHAPAARTGANSEPELKPGVTVKGTITEKIRSQLYGTKFEYRIQVTLERDSSSGLPVANRYYCCSFYVGEEQAALLHTGKPVRIKIDQD